MNFIFALVYIILNCRGDILKIFNKIEFKLSIVIILALLLQVFMPVIENYVYAREEVEAEDIEGKWMNLMK